jgi:hypothetical protein
VIGLLDALTCLVVACFLFPLGVWGRAQAEDLVVDALPSEEREHRVAVLRRGALTCQVVAVVFGAGAIFLLLV